MIGGKATVIEKGTFEDKDVDGKPKVIDYTYMFSDSEWKKLRATDNYIIDKITSFTRQGTPNIKEEKFELAKEWLNWSKRKTYKELVFDTSWVQSEKPDDYPKYNTWYGLSTKPKEHKDQITNINTFWQLVNEVVCDSNPEVLNFIQNWYAHVVQKPYVKTAVALILRGQEGIGKNSIITPLQNIFGGNFGVYTNMERLLGNFNADLMNKVIIYANEATWGGNKTKEGVLKALVTDKAWDIEMKGKDKFSSNNFVNLIVASNNDWCISASLDQRRYAFFNVNNLRKGDKEFWKHIYSFIETEEFTEALCYWLMQRNINNFSAYNEIPEILFNNGSDVVHMSIEHTQQFIVEWLSKALLEDLPPSLKMVGTKELIADDLYIDYCKFCDNMKIQHRDTEITFLRKVFGVSDKKVGWIPKELSFRKTHNNKKVTCYLIPNIIKCRNHFEEHFCAGRKQDWFVENSELIHSQPNLSNSSFNNIVQINNNKTALMNKTSI
jgi:hypothetical protein